jgi:transcriptional regulator with XRE-family HTH domain
LKVHKKMESKEAPSLPLKNLRVAAGLTQQQLAATSGVNIRQIQRIELGEAKIGNVTLSNAVAIAKALGVSPEDLL